jgi:magnesium chelatase family protein
LTAGAGRAEDRPVLARVLSAALLGVEGVLVRVEVDVSSGLPAFTTVGLPDSAVRESRERVRTAIRNAGFAFPGDRITVNLVPADLCKEGTAFDLPIALSILAATGLLKRDEPFAVVGELALDGQIQPVRGTLAVVLACRRRGITTVRVPAGNRAEAGAVDGVRPLGAAVEDWSTESSASITECHPRKFFLQSLPLGRAPRFSETIHEQEEPRFLGFFGLKTGLDQIYEHAIGACLPRLGQSAHTPGDTGRN